MEPGQVRDRQVWNAGNETGQFPVHLLDCFAHSLAGTGGRWDDVLGQFSAIIPHIPRGWIHSILDGGNGTQCGLPDIN